MSSFCELGPLVPADLRLLSDDECECDEGILTGEPMPVVKSSASTKGPDSQDHSGCAFMGTIVHEGSAVGVVVQTGPRTAFGKIAAGLSEHQGQTAFEIGLSRFSRFLFGVAAALTAFIFVGSSPGGRGAAVHRARSPSGGSCRS